MHEWALAESVSASIQRELEKHDGARLEAINLVFGELQNIDTEIFRTGLEQMLSDLPSGIRPLPFSEMIRIESEPARFRCNACSREWGLAEQSGLTDDEREAIHFLPEAAHAFLHCPGCGSTDYQVTRGRGVTLSSIELIDADGAD